MTMTKDKWELALVGLLLVAGLFAVMLMLFRATPNDPSKDDLKFDAVCENTLAGQPYDMGHERICVRGGEVIYP